jgi:hypothetical protein
LVVRRTNFSNFFVECLVLRLRFFLLKARFSALNRRKGPMKDQWKFWLKLAVFVAAFAVFAQFVADSELQEKAWSTGGVEAPPSVQKAREQAMHQAEQDLFSDSSAEI